MAFSANGRFHDPGLVNGNERVARLVKRTEAALPQPPSVAALAQEFAMSPRTLSRHVQHATGKSTLAQLQSVRLNRARMLIESSRLTLDRVAEQVGYADAMALRRLMRKLAGLNRGGIGRWVDQPGRCDELHWPPAAAGLARPMSEHG